MTKRKWEAALSCGVLASLHTSFCDVEEANVYSMPLDQVQLEVGRQWHSIYFVAYLVIAMNPSVVLEV
jgi:hypothetical protein